MIRRPAVAGQFYPGAKEALKSAVNEYLQYDVKPMKVLGLAAPHAGYIYSGATAGHTYASAVIPKKCIILSPNHTGMGASAAIMSSGEWSMPMGSVPVDEKLASALIYNCQLLKDDSTAHVAEHSLEVQLPFLQARQPELSIVPITLQHMVYENCYAIGMAIARTIKDSGEDILIVASTDMNHYENQETTTQKDDLAIKEVLALDPKALLNTCGENRVTMCGVIPTSIMLIACKELGAKEAKLVEHTTSGDVSGDYDAVVGYAGFLVY
jgi:AmmeMemoRadiSam system protein B